MIKVLVVDDSAVVRQVFQKALGAYPDIQVVGTAPDPYLARDMIVEREPDVLTLDVEMPRMDGLTFLRKLMHYHPMPVVVVSSLTKAGGELAMEALEAGAVAVLSKPGAAFSVGNMVEELAETIRGVAHVKLNQKAIESAEAAKKAALGTAPLTRTTEQVVAIGASTGGTVAIEEILSALPPDAPGIIVTQHMPEVFTRHFAERLDTMTSLKVREAKDGESVVSGMVLIAPGNQHLVLRRSGARYYVQVKDGPRVNRHRPSVDVMFRSTAQAAGRNAIGVILTGMGGDGAEGLLEMRQAGAHTIGQDEATSIVFGMPRVAIEMDAVCEIRPLPEIAGAILKAVGVGTQAPVEDK